MIDNDDRQIGRILSRREVLALLGASGAALLAGCGPAQSAAPPTATAAPSGAAPTQAAPACVVRPEVTEGPYYVDEELDRSDVRADPAGGAVKDGAPLLLTFNVSQVQGGVCAPLAGAKVEIWHCDAAGQYSDVADRSFDTRGQRWLRGYQITDAGGRASFTTIYPGCYPGRAVHIHFKVRPTESGEFTSQLFFDDALSDRVLAAAPYKGPQGRTLNSRDGIYRPELLLAVAPSGDGYAASFDVGVDVG